MSNGQSQPPRQGGGPGPRPGGGGPAHRPDRGPPPGGRPYGREESPTIDTTGIELRRPSPELFDAIASRTAKTISEERQRNKPSQIRKFFDELVMWEAKVSGGSSEADRQTRLDEALPFIRMLNAKGAYAEGRKLVDKNFQTLLGHCLRQVEDPATLRHCKLFFEAFLGFYKAYRPSDN